MLLASDDNDGDDTCMQIQINYGAISKIEQQQHADRTGPDRKVMVTICVVSEYE